MKYLVHSPPVAPVFRMNPRLGRHYGGSYGAKESGKAGRETLEEAIANRELWAKRAAYSYARALPYGGRKVCASKYAYWSQRVKDLQAGGVVPPVPVDMYVDSTVAAESEILPTSSFVPLIVVGVGAVALLGAFAVVMRKRKATPQPALRA